MKAAIAGIGQTEYSKASGRTELALACEAVHAALADAGLTPGDVDAVVRYDWDNIDELTLATHMGFGSLRWMSQAGDGGPSGNAVIWHAATVIEMGLADTVVCYRALNGRSGARIGSADDEPHEVAGAPAFQVPWGMVAPVTQFGQFARRHVIEYGTTSEQFGAVAVAMRRHATTNPNAVMRTPMTLADHQSSRMIADPLRLLDCCIETDGACAVVLTRADRARDLKQPPVRVIAGAQASAPGGGAAEVFRTDLDVSEAALCAKDLYARAGLQPADVDAVMVYDHFTPFVIMALESYGFCERGEGGPFVEDGRIEIDGELPVNTHGGNLSEAYLQGLSHVIEAVRQLRGEAVNQVDGAEIVLSCSATAGTASAVLLGRDA